MSRYVDQLVQNQWVRCAQNKSVVNGRAYTKTKVPPLLTRLLCILGCHDFRMISKTFGFGTGGGVETVECLRCGVTMTRRA